LAAISFKGSEVQEEQYNETLDLGFFGNKFAKKGSKHENFGSSFLHHQSVPGWAAYELELKIIL
jgi:hypothetical protein